METHTYCFKYKNKYYKICYVWIEAINEDVALIKFNEECTDSVKILSIEQTFNWK